jgi:hypothetical protein
VGPGAVFLALDAGTDAQQLAETLAQLAARRFDAYLVTDVKPWLAEPEGPAAAGAE